jgi:hypothetical protein
MRYKVEKLIVIQFYGSPIFTDTKIEEFDTLHEALNDCVVYATQLTTSIPTINVVDGKIELTSSFTYGEANKFTLAITIYE